MNSLTTSFKLNISIFLIFVISLILICGRYLSPEFNIELKSITLFGSICFVNFFIIIGSFYLYKQYINVLSLFSVFIFFFAYSNIQLTNNYVQLSKNTIIVVLITIFSFILGLLYPFVKHKLPQYKLNNSKFENFLSKATKDRYLTKYLYIFFVLSIISFLMESYRLGYIPVFEMFNRFVYEELNLVYIPFVHYFVMLLTIIPSWAYIFYKQSQIRKWEYLIIHFVSIFILFNYFSRQLLILYLLSFFITYNYYYRMTVFKAFTAVAIVLFTFFFVGYMRVLQDKSFRAKNNANIQNEYLLSASQAKYKMTTIESYGALYSSARFYALDRLVCQKDNSNYYGYGIYTFKPVISLLLLNRFGVVDYESKFNIPNDIPTFVVDSYLDFGYFGSFIINLIYGIFSSCSFVAYQQKKNHSIINLSLVFFCIIMMPFMNYFNTFFVWMVYGVNRVLIK